MLGLELPSGPLRLACLAAHCDDVEIGAGGTLLRLLADHPGTIVDWLVLSSTPEREREEQAAIAAFCVDASEVFVQIEGLPENVLPSLSREVQGIVGEMAERREHDLVLAPSLHDRHQDHRLLAEVAHQKWRVHPIWGYEIAKWDGDLTTPNLYVRLDEDTVARKVELLEEHFPSQHGRQWYDAEAFRSILRLRGIESATRYAEGFHTRKTVV